jgi:16S rRNA processing protein RimM
MSDARLRVGYLAGAHGIRGGVLITLHDNDSQALRPGLRIALVRDDVDLGWYVVREVAPIPGRTGRHRAALVGLHDRDEAEALKGCAVELERDELPELPEDEFYLADAIGLPVRRATQEPELLGVVTGVMNNGAQDLFEIEWTDPGGGVHAWLLPVLPGFVLDVDAQRVLADPPLGMLPDALERS